MTGDLNLKEEEWFSETFEEIPSPILEEQENQEESFYFSDSIPLDELLGEEMSDEIEEAIIPEKATLPESVRAHVENPPFIKKALEQINSVDEYAWNRGTMGLDTGFENLNKSLNGLNTGLILFAGGSNTGKSAVLLQLSSQVAKMNNFISELHPKKAFSLYFSLDDSNNELMPRLIATDQKMPINDVLYPKSIEKHPTSMLKREQGFQNLKDNVRYYAMNDASNGSSIEKIEATIKEYKEQLEMMAPEEYRLVIFIDNFHDITVEAPGYTEDNARFDYISGALNDIAIEFDSPVVCSAEFRKINALKRPQLDEIKSSGKITYEAKAIILVYNEVGQLEDQSDVYWEMTNHQTPEVPRKMPVFEMHVAKNKFTSFKGRHFLRFLPEMALFIEPSEEEAMQYLQMMKG